MCLGFPCYKSINYNYINYCLRNYFCCRDYNQNCTNYSLANYFRDDFVDHDTKGLLMVVSKRWFEFCPEIEFRYPLVTSIEPPFYLIFASQDTFDHDKGQKSVISGRRLHWRLSTEFFAFSPVFMCNLVRRAPKIWRK